MEELFDPTIVTLLNPSNEDFPIVYNNKIFRTIPPRKAMRLPRKPFGVLAEKHLIDRMCNMENKPTNDPLTREKWRKIIVLDEDQDLSAQPLTPEQVYERQLDKLNRTNEAQQITTCDTCGTKTFNLIEHNMLNHLGTQPTPPAPTQPQATVAAVTPPVRPVIPQVPIVPTIPDRPEIINSESLMPLPVDKPAPQTEAQKAAANIIQGVTGKVAKEEGAFTLPEAKEDPPVTTPVDTTPKAPPTREQLIAYARDTLLMKVEDPKTKELLDSAPIDQLIRELNYGM